MISLYYVLVFTWDFPTIIYAAIYFGIKDLKYFAITTSQLAIQIGFWHTLTYGIVRLVGMLCTIVGSVVGYLTKF